VTLRSTTDVIGYNVYLGWYMGSPSDFPNYIDGLHQSLPGRPLAVSEHGAGASVQQHQSPPSKPDPGGSFHPGEWQSLFHETYWKAMKTRRYLWGKFVWNMFDFASDGRNEGDTPGRNDKGLVTYNRLTRKDAFTGTRRIGRVSPLSTSPSGATIPVPAATSRYACIPT
jgi:beta-galactosidase